MKPIVVGCGKPILRWNPGIGAAAVLLGLCTIGLTDCVPLICEGGKVPVKCGYPAAPGQPGGTVHYVCAEPLETNPCGESGDVCDFTTPGKYPLSSPLLTYTTLDGPVDFGTSQLKVEMSSDGDSLETPLS